MALPERLVARFRAVTLERIARIEVAWGALTSGGGTPELEGELYRDLHTLKGEARVVGFAELATLCEKLEELVCRARERRFRVHEDVDIVITMGFQLATALVRRRHSSGALDVSGFVRQIDDVLREGFSEDAAEIAESSEPRSQGRASTTDSSLSAGAVQRLAMAANNLFVESLREDGAARERLREIFAAMAAELSDVDAGPLASVVARHATSAAALARELGKDVDVQLDVGDVRVRDDVLEAINVALLHTLRNAVDHGIEPPEQRASAGKPRAGRLRVHAHRHRGGIRIRVEDDGAGVDVDAVRARAVELGLVAPTDVASVPDAELLQLVFQPGFSTRSDVTPISGRGIGMDAARASVERLGGAIRLESVRGAGSWITIEIPSGTSSLDVVAFLAPRHPDIVLAVPAEWQPVLSHAAVDAIDPLSLLGISPRAEQTTSQELEVLALRRGRRTLSFFAGRRLDETSASRLLPATPSAAYEAIRVGGRDALLFRPELVSREVHSSAPPALSRFP